MFLASLKQSTKLTLLISVLVILVVLSYLFYIFIIRRNRQRKIARDLEKKYHHIHEILSDDIIEKSIERVHNISLVNEDYVSYYEKFEARSQEILEVNDKDSYIIITNLNQTIADKKFRGLNSFLDSAKKTVSEFEKCVNGLQKEINDLLAKDEEFRNKEVFLQRQYREIKEKYSAHEHELSLMSEVFTKMFTKIDNMFAECEELTDAGRYEESTEKLPLIKKVLDELLERFDELPAYCMRISNIIPGKIENINARFEELEIDKYPLHHLKVISKTETFKERLDALTKRLLAFKLDKIKKELDEIDNEILEIMKNLQNEEDSKIYFDTNWQKIYSSTFEVERKFMKLKRNLPQYKEIYLLKDKYLDKVDELENDIDKVGQIKRDLDTYMHSSTKQPYSFLVLKTKDLENEVLRIDSIINEFNTYLGSLKVDTENAYSKICKYFILLKDAQAEVRDIAVNEFSLLMKNRFDTAYDYLERIGDIIKVKPIDVAAANETLLAADELINELLRDVKKQSGERQYAEETIVYANQYLQDFAEVSYTLKSASDSFFQGNFTDTISETVGMIRRIRPEVANEE